MKIFDGFLFKSSYKNILKNLNNLKELTYQLLMISHLNQGRSGDCS